jgi:hypothetical protein
VDKFIVSGLLSAGEKKTEQRPDIKTFRQKLAKWLMSQRTGCGRFEWEGISDAASSD